MDTLISFSVIVKYAFGLAFNLSRSTLPSKTWFSINSSFIEMAIKSSTLNSQIKFH